MDRPAFQECAARAGLPTWSQWLLPESYHIFGSSIVIGDRLEKLAIILADVAMLATGKPDSVCDHGVQNGLEFSGRLCDDPQHFTGRCLLFQSLSEFAVVSL